MTLTPKQNAILAQLHPDLRRAVDAIMAIVPVLPVCGYRSLEEQAALFAQGRTKPGAKVTWARPGQSPHNFNPPGVGDGALACDFMIDTSRVKVRLRKWQGKDYPDAWDDVTPSAVAVWRALGEAAKAQGLTWGGAWGGPKVDKPHVELADWKDRVRGDLKVRL